MPAVSRRSCIAVSLPKGRRSARPSKPDQQLSHRLPRGRGTPATCPPLPSSMKFPATLLLVLVAAVSGAGCVSAARKPDNAVVGGAVDAAAAGRPRDASPSGTAFFTPPAATTEQLPASPGVKRVELLRGTSDLSLVDRRYMV